MPELNTARASEYRALAERRLPPKTFRHVVSVAEYMLSFAGQAGITPDQAVASGILHDLCKPMKNDQLLRAAKKYNIELIPLFHEYPGILHGPVAAEEARHAFAIGDDVYDAIYWHTTGRPDWNPVGCALYLGDFSEPLRPAEAAAETRDILQRHGFHAALKFAIRAKLNHVAQKATVDPLSRAFQQWVEKEFPE